MDVLCTTVSSGGVPAMSRYNWVFLVSDFHCINSAPVDNKIRETSKYKSFDFIFTCRFHPAEIMVWKALPQINNKILLARWYQLIVKDLLAGFKCVHEDDAVMVEASASARTLSSLDHYCIVRVRHIKARKVVSKCFIAYHVNYSQAHACTLSSGSQSILSWCYKYL